MIKNESIDREKKAPGSYAAINGLDMYYEIHGEGQPLVLIHGGGSTIQSTFGNLIPLLAKSHKIIAVELQAHGHTSDRPAPESFENDADDVAALLRHLKINKANILGFSNGGNTAMKIGMRYQQLVNKLVVISAFYKREGMMPGFFEGMQHASLDNMPAPLKDAYLQAKNDQAGLRNMFEKDKARMLGFTDWDDSVLKLIHAPTLVISGDQDVVLPAHAVKLSQTIPGARLMILPGTHGSFIGEICSVEKGSRQTELTAGMIDEFLGKEN